MQAEYVCRKTEEYGWGGRVAIGHVTQLSLLAAGPVRRDRGYAGPGAGWQ